MSIKLRSKKLSNGMESLYLDIYHGGRRTKEFLDIRLYVSPKSIEERKHNKALQQVADTIRDQKAYDLATKGYDIVMASTREEVNFFDYLQEFVDHYHKGDIRMYHSNQRYLKEYVGSEYLSVKSMDEKFCQRYKDFLDNHPKLKGSTPSDFFSKFKRVLKSATRDKLFTINPAQDVVNSRKNSIVEKDVLTFEEIQKLANTPCGNENVKRAFLFACYTGLRFCDIDILEWNHVQDRVIKIKQLKTKKPVTVILNDVSLSLLGERTDNTRVFTLPSHTSVLKVLRSWTKRAGIDKHITFHCARHSLGTNLHLFDIDIATISKMLGHSTLSHTQKYVREAEILKQRAIERLPQITFEPSKR